MCVYADHLLWHLQVSALILQGSIPVGNEYEKFVPLFHREKRWMAFVTAVFFITLASIMALPDMLQAMVRLSEE